jgi:hypothetical protein
LYANKKSGRTYIDHQSFAGKAPHQNAEPFCMRRADMRLYDADKTGDAVDSHRQRFYDKEVSGQETIKKERMEEATIYGNQSEQS